MMPSVPVDLSSTRRLHVVGVGGPGMSAIAIVLAEMGHRVSGSDIREQPEPPFRQARQSVDLSQAERIVAAALDASAP